MERESERERERERERDKKKCFIAGPVIMDLSKAFNCILHKLVIAKLAAYGIEREILRLIYSYF